MLQRWGSRASACALLICVCAVVYVAARRAGREGVAYRPVRDDEPILAGLGSRADAALHARLRAEPRNFALAFMLARQQIDSARASGDPRPLGRAEAILAPFADQARPELYVLRATIAQARHDFSAALVDLERALALDADDAQAYLTRASLLTVLGRYREAREACEPLGRLAPGFVRALCSANVDGYNGERTRALATFQQALAQTRLPSERAWALSLLCEHAFWGGELERADGACRASLALDASDRYTRALYADVLLERGQPERVLALTAEQRALGYRDDALLLRRALAARAVEADEAVQLAAMLEARFAHSRARGDRVHQREEARFLLALGREPREALRLAREGFAAQRELWDVRLLLAAAQAAGDRRAARPALQFMLENKLDSRLLSAQAARLGSGS
jgi:Tfp pilus assembly protein PilF